jgi:hypothetical protein
MSMIVRNMAQHVLSLSIFFYRIQDRTISPPTRNQLPGNITNTTMHKVHVFSGWCHSSGVLFVGQISHLSINVRRAPELVHFINLHTLNFGSSFQCTHSWVVCTADTMSLLLTLMSFKIL